MVAPERGVAEVNGGSLYYEVAGAGPPMLLVHGGLADRHMWDDQFAPFADRFRGARFDQRGFGESSSASGEISFYEDIRGVLDALDMEKGIIVGLFTRP